MRTSSHSVRSAFWMGALTSAILGVGLIALSVFEFKQYGMVLFVLFQFIISSLASIIASLRVPLTTAQSIGAGMTSLAIVGLLLMILGIEGAMCIIMSIPIAGGTAIIGGAAGEWIRRSRWGNRTPTILTLFLLLPPSFLTIEHHVKPDCVIHPITTAIGINAPPNVVWDHVISFAEIDPPTEFVFKSGIAYPIRARIVGTGVGAIRYCDFSTGSFVEPITHWEENRRLAFSVEEQPIPMKELSPYGDIEPAHLHGYFVSTKGEFRLIDLGNGRTRLEGTTWYYQRLHPGFYWNLWADRIIHAIHIRVLKHIKEEAEEEAGSTSRDSENHSRVSNFSYSS